MSPGAPPARVVEQRRAGALPLWVHPPWQERFPWLVHGVTGREDERGRAFDLGLGGEQPVGDVLRRWELLRRGLGAAGVAHGLQVHGTELCHHRAVPPGLCVVPEVDGHLCAEPGLLLTVSAADCVPVLLVATAPRAVALLHAGWRGTAAGIVERGIEGLRALGGAAAEALHLHCGPAICGRCYEVGPEVHAAVRPGADPPAAPAPLDLRAAIAERALACGVPDAQISVSAHCTRCGPGAFFSHRGGDAGRQVAVLGVRG